MQSTSESAISILSKIEDASRSMSASTTAATSSFVKYLDGEGVELSRSLTGHFTELEGHLVAQQAGMTNIQSMTQGYVHTTASSVVKPTGNTPTKKPFAELLPLQ